MYPDAVGTKVTKPFANFLGGTPKLFLFPPPLSKVKVFKALRAIGVNKAESIIRVTRIPSYCYKASQSFIKLFIIETIHLLDL